jgi:2'-5' RNA ligase
MFPISTVVIVAPHDVQAIAVPILRRHAPDHLIRFPAHISLMLPFVPLEALKDACEKLHELCAAVDPFDITLSGYERVNCEAYLRMVNPEPIQEIIAQLHKTFPEQAPYGRKIMPHLTVAKFANESEQRTIQLPEYVAITFRVYRLHVMYGIEQVTLPWIAYNVVPLSA